MFLYKSFREAVSSFDKTIISVFGAHKEIPYLEYLPLIKNMGFQATQFKYRSKEATKILNHLRKANVAELYILDAKASPFSLDYFKYNFRLAYFCTSFGLYQLSFKDFRKTKMLKAFNFFSGKRIHFTISKESSRADTKVDDIVHFYTVLSLRSNIWLSQVSNLFKEYILISPRNNVTNLHLIFLKIILHKFQIREQVIRDSLKAEAKLFEKFFPNLDLSMIYL